MNVSVASRSGSTLCGSSYTSGSPLSSLRTQEALQVEGLLTHQHEVHGASDAVGEDRQGLGLAVLPFDAAEKFLALRTLRQNSTAASENAHLRWALPILAPEEPTTFPADIC